MATLQSIRFYKVSRRVQTGIVVNKLFLAPSLPSGHAQCRDFAAKRPRKRPREQPDIDLGTTGDLAAPRGEGSKAAQFVTAQTSNALRSADSTACPAIPPGQRDR
jgi:hypothetical protein